jgi:hypothetical protein
VTGQAQPLQPHHLLVAQPAAVAPVRPQALLARGRRRQGVRGGGGLLRHGARGLANGTAATLHPALQGLPETAEEAPPVGDLLRVRRALPHRVGIGAGAIAGDDLDPAVPPQPGRECRHLPVGQQVGDPVAFQVDQDGPVGLWALQPVAEGVPVEPGDPRIEQASRGRCGAVPVSGRQAQGGWRAVCRVHGSWRPVTVAAPGEGRR